MIATLSFNPKSMVAHRLCCEALDVRAMAVLYDHAPDYHEAAVNTITYRVLNVEEIGKLLLWLGPTSG